jgi:predicted transcriptional regulator
MVYYIDEHTLSHEIFAYTNLEDALLDSIEEWNSQCENGSEITTEGEKDIIRKVARPFFNNTGFISISILHAMIVQSF